MSTLNKRFAAQPGQSVVVFLVGMRMNQPLRVRKWSLVTSAFPKMVRELYAHPEWGFLGGENFFRVFPLTTIFLSYWKTLESLERYATGKLGSHASAWGEFNRRIGTDGSVGVWHETYSVSVGQYESRYVNMPYFGLGKAFQHVTENPAYGLGSAGGPVGEVSTSV